MKILTERQCEVLKFFEKFTEENETGPSVREVAREFNVSATTALNFLSALQQKGYLGKAEGRSRGYHLLRRHNGMENGLSTKIPLLGDIAAGLPILSEENDDGQLCVDRSFLKNGREYFAVRVTGDSMHDAGIIRGDMVIIEKRDYADNGDIVAVDIEGKGHTLKRYFKESARVRLHSENEAEKSKYPDIYTKDVRILGRLVHVIRSYGEYAR
jgi:repressor LexA